MANPAQKIEARIDELARSLAPGSPEIQITLVRLANQIVNDAKRNVGQVLTMRSGQLRRSIGFRLTDSGVEIGAFGVSYARIHEFGGVITPKRRAYLTIPADRPFIGRSALNFDLRFGRIPAKGGKRYLFTQQGTAAYRLVKRVEIKARPYLRPAIRENESFAIELIERLVTGE